MSKLSSQPNSQLSEELKESAYFLNRRNNKTARATENNKIANIEERLSNIEKMLTVVTELLEKREELSSSDKSKSITSVEEDKQRVLSELLENLNENPLEFDSDVPAIIAELK